MTPTTRVVERVCIGLGDHADWYQVGSDGVTEIREITMAGQCGRVPGIQVWCGEELWIESHQIGCTLHFSTPERDKSQADPAGMPF